MKCRVVSAAIAATLACAATSHAEPMFRGGPAHAGVYAGSVPHAFHRVKWTFPTGGKIVSSPVVQDGVVYVGSDDGSIYAVDAASGKRRWLTRTRGAVSSTPAIAGGTLYAASWDGRLYALDTKSGAIEWKFATGGERHFEAKGVHGLQPRNQTIADMFDMYLSSPVVANGAVFFGSGDDNVYALDAKTGELRWKFATGDVVHASPAFADGAVYVGSWDSWFYAIDAATGKQRWRFHGGEDEAIHNQVGFQSSAAVVDGTVYVGCRDSNLYALDAVTGTEKWRFNNAGSWVIVSPAVADGKVYFATSDSALYHVADAASGKPVLQQQDKAYVFGSPAVVGDSVVLAITNGTLEVRDRASGEVRWEFRTDASTRNDDWVLTADRQMNGAMHFRTGTQTEAEISLDQVHRNGAIFSSPTVADGVIYVGSSDGNLYALE